MGMWSQEAIKAAEAEYGRRNYRALAFRRNLPMYATVAALIGGVFIARGVAQSWQPEWTGRLGFAGLVLVALLVVGFLATRTRRRGYKRY